MDESPLTPSDKPRSNDNELMAQLRSLLVNGPKGQQEPANELVRPDYVALWKVALMEGRKLSELYDSDSKWGKKPPLTREDFARMVYSDLLDRSRRRDFDSKK